MSAPIPLIACGAIKANAQAIKAALLPECEYIHICFGVEQACSDIPQILAGSVPANNEENVGSKDYSKTAAAIVLGGPYSDSDYEKIKGACKGKDNVPWLRMDASIPTPEPLAEWAPAVANRLKKVLRELEADGKLGQDGLYFY